MHGNMNVTSVVLHSKFSSLFYDLKQS